MALNFKEQELIWLKRIITDQDGEEALAFVNQVIKPWLKEVERPSGLKRTFDAGGPPGQIGSSR